MLIRLTLSLLVALVVGLGTVRAWQSLRQFNEDQVARIAEAEAWAARRQLESNLDKLLGDLQGAQVYWSTYGTQPYEEWKVDVAMDPVTIACATTILWEDPLHATRFSRSLNDPAGSGKTPAVDAERLISRAQRVRQDTLAGPWVDSSGRPWLEVYLMDEENPSAGRLATIIDARQCLASLMLDESPGFAVEVRAGDVTLYQRGLPVDPAPTGPDAGPRPGGSPASTPATGGRPIPESWIRTGEVRAALGPPLTVVHTPLPGFASQLQSPAIDLLLLLGLVIAVLMGTLTFENWRAQVRARDAEQAERELADLNRSLERTVEQRTRDLAQRTRDLQTVTDSVAHDMRNPLSTIAMNVQLFEARNADSLADGSLAPLRRVEPAIRQMTDILDRMMNLSELAHRTFERRPVDMNALVREVYDSLTATGPDQHAALEVTDLPPVEADPKMAGMLLVNLLGNALKYTRPVDDARIRVSAEERDGVAVYTVADNGIGFDPRFTDQLFQAFERLDQDRKSEGTGLGLTIVARVVERHGGWIRAEGTPGEGAAFHFTLEPSDTVHAGT